MFITAAFGSGVWRHLTSGRRSFVLRVHQNKPAPRTLQSPSVWLPSFCDTMMSETMREINYMYHILEKLRSDPAAGSVVKTEQEKGPALVFQPVFQQIFQRFTSPKITTAEK